MKYSNNNKPLECMMTQSTCYKGTTKMTVKGVLWHSTGANNPNLKRYVQPDDNAANRSELISKLGTNSYKNDWNHITVQAGLNAWIGKLADGTVTTVQTMPWDFKPWGCGSGSRGSCNNGWIQFEICEDGLSDKTYFDKVYKEACELTAYLCKMYNLDPMGYDSINGYEIPVILCHADANSLKVGSAHGDVLHWFPKHGKTMDDVRKDVAKLMGTTAAIPESKPIEPKPNPAPAPSNPTPVPSVSNKKIETNSVVKVNSDAVYTNGKSVPDFVKNLEWIVHSVSGNRVVINKSADGKYAIMSPIDIKYLTLVDTEDKEEEKVDKVPAIQAPVSEFKPYVITVTASLLNYRSGPGSNYSVKGQIKKGGAYTIVEEKDGWGKLKSGAGWIALEYTKKI